jgi:putative tryptophan/tyrosine transport system substrate-binding protein
MKRREFITLLGGTAAWPLAALAQQGERMRRVGVLMNGPATDAELQSHLAAFVQGLRQLGWIEGKNLRLDIRWPPGDAALAQTYAAQLIGLMPDVILAVTKGPIAAAKRKLEPRPAQTGSLWCLVYAVSRFRRQAPGGVPTHFLKARLKAASDS